MAIAPAMTLNRMYHCVPSAIRNTLPRLIGMRVAMKNATMNGNVMFTGNDAAICASGCAMRATRGRRPIQTPIGVQIRVAMTLMASDAQQREHAQPDDAKHLGAGHVGPDFLDDVERVEDEPSDRQRDETQASHRAASVSTGAASTRNRSARSEQAPTRAGWRCPCTSNVIGEPHEHVRASQQVEHPRRRMVLGLRLLQLELLGPRHQRPPDELVDDDDGDDHRDDRVDGSARVPASTAAAM